MHEAAQRLASMSQGENLFPPMNEIRKVSAHIAFAVARTAMEDGVAARIDDDALRARIFDEIWEPRYLRYRPSKNAMTRQDVLRAAKR